MLQSSFPDQNLATMTRFMSAPTGVPGYDAVETVVEVQYTYVTGPNPLSCALSLYVTTVADPPPVRGVGNAWSIPTYWPLAEVCVCPEDPIDDCSGSFVLRSAPGLSEAN
jgi:hypothetical protein